MEGHNAPVVTNPTVSDLEHPSSSSQDDDDEDMDFSSAPRKSRLSAPQLQAQLPRLSDRTRLRRLKNTLFSKGAWQQDEDSRLVPHARLSQVALPPGYTPHDFITNVQKRLGNRTWTVFGQCRLCGSFLDPQLEHGETCSTAEATRGHYACVHAVSGGLKLEDPGITTEPRGVTETQSMLADLFTAAAVPGRSAALDVCAAAARGDKALAAFDRELTHYKQEIPDSRNHRIHCPSLVWTADRRPHPAVTGTLQYAGDIASSRNGQQMSAKSLQHRWKHEIQIAFLRRRAAMTGAVQPNPSARAESLLAGLTERALNHWGHAPSS